MKTILFALVAAVLFLSGCSSAADSGGVASLERTADTNGGKTTADASDNVLSEEAAMMAFVECARDGGIEYEDPLVDSDGNVQKPQLVEGVAIDKKKYAVVYDECNRHLEGVTFGKEEDDVSETVDDLMALAECLNGKGYEVVEPTAETLDGWWGEFKSGMNWNDPAAMADYEECSGTAGGGSGAAGSSGAGGKTGGGK